MSNNPDGELLELRYQAGGMEEYLGCIKRAGTPTPWSE